MAGVGPRALEVAPADQCAGHWRRCEDERGEVPGGWPSPAPGGAAAWRLWSGCSALDLMRSPFFAAGRLGGGRGPVWMVSRAGGLGCDYPRRGRKRLVGAYLGLSMEAKRGGAMA